MKSSITLLLLSFIFSMLSCKETKKEILETSPKATKIATRQKIKVIFDTDANNELDDQFAIAYMLFNGNVFDVRGITVNATRNDKNVQGHYDEAERIMQLCNPKVTGSSPVPATSKQRAFKRLKALFIFYLKHT